MVKPIKWLTRPIRRRRAEREAHLLRERRDAAASAAAAEADERRDRRETYGALADEAAAAADERHRARDARTAAGQQAASAVDERTTHRQTLMHLLKGNVGPGCLSLPWSFSQLGIGWGVVATALIGLWTYYNCATLIRVKFQHTSNRRTITYSDLGEVAYGKRFRSVVTASIVLLQLAICTVYLSFVGSNLQALWESWECPSWLTASPAWSIVMVVPIVTTLTIQPNLKALGPVSELAMGVLLLAFAMLGIVLAQNWKGDSDEQEGGRPPLPSFNWAQAPMAACGILYAFEGICIVLPLEASMHDRSQFKSMFAGAYAGVTVLYCAIGAVCVWVLGSVEDGSITSYLMSHSDEYDGVALVTVSNLLAALAVLLTYALTMFPCVELWCQAMERRDRGGKLEGDEEEDSWWGGELAYGPHDTPLLRLSLMAATVAVAAAVPNVSQLIGLAGAIAGAATALIIPPMLALHFAETDHPGRGTFWKSVEYLLLALGVAFGLLGTVAALNDIFKKH